MSEKQRKNWFTLTELAALKLPYIPHSAWGLQKHADQHHWRECLLPGAEPAARKREGRGGGWEYHYSLLPPWALADIVRRGLVLAEAGGLPDTRDIYQQRREKLVEAWEAAPEKRREKARKRLDALRKVNNLEAAGWGTHKAVCEVGRQFGVHQNSIYNWKRAVEDWNEAEWLMALMPKATLTKTRTAPCDEAAWEFYRSDYLRAEQPSHAACYRRLQKAAKLHAWTIPSAKTLERKLHREVSSAVITLAREGEEAARRQYPAQQRDKRGMHALQQVNGDGHKFDVMVKWPDGSVGRPIMVAFQDVYSGKFLSWRIGRTENRELVQLTFRDLCLTWGIPEEVLLDNGRAFASKAMSGGTPTRFRFKARPADPEGVFKRLGVAVRWATPYSGQSKPIERAFRDLVEDLARSPEAAGAFTGNTIANKPHNYGSKAIPLDVWEEIVAAKIEEHNDRPDRRAPVAAGRSLNAVFAESYENSIIRKGTELDLVEALLFAEAITARKPDGALHFMGNRYWGRFLTDWIGKALHVRYDPGHLHQPLRVYRPDGSFLGTAECIEAAGFTDTNAARQHAKDRKKYTKDVRAAMRFLGLMAPEELATVLHDPNAAASRAQAPEAKVVRLFEEKMRRAEDGEREELGPGEYTQAEIFTFTANALSRLREEKWGDDPFMDMDGSSHAGGA